MNFQPLPREKYAQVEPLFARHMDHNLFCAGVITGKYDGQVIVDDPAQPRTAWVIKGGTWCYLGGAADNEAFNQALGRAIMEKQFIGEETGSVFLSPTSADWAPVFAALVPDRTPVVMPRRLYVAQRQITYPEIVLPEGFVLHFIDETLPEEVTGDLPGDVQDVLDLRTKGTAPNEAAFGYVVLHDGRCAAWSMVDCIVGRRGDIGLVTEEPFRRRGLAFAVSTATITYGLKHGLEAIHWDCMIYNRPSLNLAEKLGLEPTLDHKYYAIIFHPVIHLANLAWLHLDAGEYEQTLAVVNDQLFKENDKSVYGHFLAGAAWAGLGDAEQALHYLKTAVDLGWDDAAELLAQPTLQILHDTPEWTQLLARIQTE